MRTARRFETVALAYSPPGAALGCQCIRGASSNTTECAIARRRVWRALSGIACLPRRAVVDYDTFYRSLNTASLLGTLQLPARWSLSFDAERRNSPVLTTRNALIGQPATTLAQLEQMSSAICQDDIQHWARDRTPSRPITASPPPVPWASDSSSRRRYRQPDSAATMASGGGGRAAGSGTELTYQAQIYGSSLWSTGDFSVLTATYANTEIGKWRRSAPAPVFP